MNFSSIFLPPRIANAVQSQFPRGAAQPNAQPGGLFDFLKGRGPRARSAIGGFFDFIERNAPLESGLGNRFGGNGTANLADFAVGEEPADEELQSGPGSEDAIAQARKEAIARAENYISNADVSGGADEDGYYEVYDTRTGEVTSYAGSEAGIPTEVDFEFHLQIGDDEVLLVTAHSHPSEPGRSDIDDNNENINSNLGDKRLRRYAPVVIKTPSGRVRTFGSPFEYRDINERR